MLVRAERVLNREEVAECRRLLHASPWIDGRSTAGDQAAGVKANLQVPEDSAEARALGTVVLRALARSDVFNSATLPFRVLPPMFNRYGPGMTFGAHVDNAIRAVPGTGGLRMRSDVSCTLFLTDPSDYAGGELVVQDAYGEHRLKLPAGDMVIYPAGSLHRVEPVRHGTRWASFFWVQSIIKEDGLRGQLHALDNAIVACRQKLGDQDDAVLALVVHYHNLIRRWAEL